MYSICSMHVSEINRVAVKGAPVFIERSSLNSSIFEQKLTDKAVSDSWQLPACSEGEIRQSISCN